MLRFLSKRYSSKRGRNRRAALTSGGHNDQQQATAPSTIKKSILRPPANQPGLVTSGSTAKNVLISNEQLTLNSPSSVQRPLEVIVNHFYEAQLKPSNTKVISISFKLTIAWWNSIYLTAIVTFRNHLEMFETLYFRSLEAVVRLGQTAKFDLPNVFSTAKLNFSMEPFTTCNCR